MHFFVPFQIDVMNKQFSSPFSRNNTLSKTAFDESYILMTHKHLDAKKITLL